MSSRSGVRRPGRVPDECRRFPDVGRQRTSSEERPRRDVAHGLGRGERLHLARMHEQAICEVVEQVGPHAGKLVHDADACAFKRLARADSRELEEMRGAHGAAAEHDLALGKQLAFRAIVRAKGDADRTSPLDEHTGCVGAGDDREIGTSPGGPEVAVEHAETAPSAL